MPKRGQVRRLVRRGGARKIASELMRFLGACVGTVVATVAIGGSGPGCNARGTLTGAGGGATLTGVGGAAGGPGGGAAGIGAFTGTAGVGPATGTGGFPSNGCGPIRPADRVPAKIVIVLDTSASMNEAADGSCTSSCGSGSKWSAVISGIESALGAGGLPATWGLKFIVAGSAACEAGSGVDVPIGPVSNAGVPIALRRRTNVSGELSLTSNTPARGAVNAASTYLYGLFTPGNSAILLMLDGEPDCGSGAADPLASDSMGTVQAIGVARTAGIATFVVGIGALAPAAHDALSRMALEGGFPRSGASAYYQVADESDVVTVIDQVVATLAECMFAIPPPPTSDGTTSRENISVYADGQQIPQDANNGWTYSDSTHTAVTLRGSSCDAIRAGALQQVTIAFNCLI